MVFCIHNPILMKTLHVQAVGLSIGALSAVCMLIMSLLALGGWYTSAYKIMQEFHIWADLTLLGTIGGMIEAAFWGYISGIAFAWLYNRLAS